jgi:hypothetical protein
MLEHFIRKCKICYMNNVLSPLKDDEMNIFVEP